MNNNAILMTNTLSLITSYLATNQVPHEKLPELVRDIFNAMATSPMSDTVNVDCTNLISDTPVKRGRPKTVKTEIVSEPVQKRGRGRPRKVVEEDVLAAPKRGRGRPRKHKLITVERFTAEKMEPACSVAESVQPEYLVCLFDGMQRISLKRHVAAKYDMTWSQYKKFFNLPSDYPSCAPNYTERKRPEALKVGLGHIAKKPKLQLVEIGEQVAMAA